MGLRRDMIPFGARSTSLVERADARPELLFFFHKYLVFSAESCNFARRTKNRVRYESDREL